jgi:putative serine protease PepD
VSEHDEEPKRPDEDTQPLPRPSQPEHEPSWQQGYSPAPYPPPPMPYGYRPQSSHRGGSNPPAWVWPVVAATALVVGVVGGIFGGVAVSTSMNGTESTVLPTNTQAAPPLETDNASVAAVAAKLLPSTVQILVDGGADGSVGGGATGSGFVIDNKGHVITNNHVVAQAATGGKIQVIDHAGHTRDAAIVGRSPVYDIAVLDVEGAEDLQPAPLGSSRSMRVGETVVAFGSPLGLSSTVTSGIVSALDRPVTTTGGANDESFINAVQTDAAINPGNSGGPLVNMRGQVVGVNSAIATMGGGFGTESGNIGVGFAIPMEQVRITAAQILQTGEAKYPVIGASVNTGNTNDGAKVARVDSGTPADDAGLKSGDVVVGLDGKPITDGIGLIVAIRTHQPGETVTLTVRRDGKQQKLRVTLDAKVG